jgi:ABC-type branched-subunit amino acid transport system substrate-binding protein
MTDSATDVLVAVYQDIDEASRDFETLVALVKEKSVEIEGVILVTHAQDGSVAVRQTGDNLGRKGMGWGGGVGLAVGLFAPPLLASVAVGAVAGGVIGKFVDHRRRAGGSNSRQERCTVTALARTLLPRGGWRRRLLAAVESGCWPWPASCRLSGLARARALQRRC